MERETKWREAYVLTFQTEQTYDLVDVSDVEIAGDGSAVVFVRQEINRETMKRESRIVMQRLRPALPST